MRILFKLSPYNQQRQFQKLVWIFPIKLAMYATALRNQGNEVIWDGRDDGSFERVITSESQIDIPFLQLPHADRKLTDAFNSKWQNNGNFKYHPGVYIQSTNSCWWGNCTFCTEKGKTNEIREVKDVINEIRECKELGAAEVFDDSATFPMEFILATEFLQQLRRVDIRFSCNLRITPIIPFSVLRASGFRMCLFGIESANQKTLDKINKGVKVEDIIPTIKKAAQARLEPHIACMFGYPWETEQEAINTLKIVHYLLRKGYAKTAQASFYQVSGETGQESHRKYIPQIYNASYHLDFWLNQLRDIHNINDLKYLWLKIKKGLKR